MNHPAFELVGIGQGASFQDLGRRGWKAFGVPPGGAQDDHAARWANRLLGNTLSAPVLEFLLQGAVLRALCRVQISLTGAAVSGGDVHWRAWEMDEGEILHIPVPPSGLWTYVGVHGGFAAPRWFGGVSIFPRGGFGEELTAGQVLCRPANPSPAWPSAVRQRWLDPTERRDYSKLPPLRVWPGPQWEDFPSRSRQRFFEATWRVSSQSDRTGYRLEGSPLAVGEESILSEPVLPGSIQVPPGGLPIVTMRDGPTVGGYPKIGLVDPDDLGWFAQCRPNQEVRFTFLDPRERPAEATSAPASRDGIELRSR